MSMTDPIADMLTRIRNAVSAKHESVSMPSSKVKIAIASVLKEEGFIRDYEVEEEENRRVLRVKLSYSMQPQRSTVLNGLQRVSKPGLRVYVQRGEIPRVYGGLGIAIISTPQGVMTGKQAWSRRVGGEILCYAW
ncbi:MAG: 30S ribosomal protein S8 [Dehalococcoidia bacterium]|nr:30S ribosomal protein S8 [Dehalococcoidia bacterium]